MSNSKLLQITLSEKMNRSNTSTAVEQFDFVLPYAQRNDNKDNQIIRRANTIAREWKQTFGGQYGNDYAFGLYQTYSEVMEGDNKLNKLTQDYIRQNFKDENSFRCYFMRHKNAPKSPLDEKC